MIMTRGFVTIATGKERFYRIAADLLMSYHVYAKDPMPFYLICDRKNKNTKDFDGTVIMPDPSRSYLDKLRLPELVPFDETIFIDADCLAYKDLNDFWAMFEGASDFSVFGKDWPEEYEYGWFKKENAGEFKDRIRSIPEFIGGVYFLRKSEALQEFGKTCRYILEHYHEYGFRQFENPADEPVIALAMAVHGFTSVGEKSPDICFYPHCTYFDADILTGTVRFSNRYMPERGVIPQAYMVHWGSGVTVTLRYRYEEYKLKQMYAGRHPGKAELASANLLIRADRIRYEAIRAVWRRIKPLVKK